MEKKELISEGLSINQLEERLEMSNGIVCCSEGIVVVCCSVDLGTYKSASGGDQ